MCVRVCDNATEMFWNHFVSFRSEPEDKHDKMKSKMKRRKISKDEPDLQESALSKKLIAYQRKVLVRRTFLFFFLSFFVSKFKIMYLLFLPTELFCKEFLQHEDAGSLSRFCHQLYSPILQGKCQCCACKPKTNHLKKNLIQKAWDNWRNFTDSRSNSNMKLYSKFQFSIENIWE